MERKLIALALTVLITLPAIGGQTPDAISPDLQKAIDHISADSLRGHLSFISSDLLEGRATPSPGLDIAAEYIAAQFRRAGLEPVGDDGYFQTATLQMAEAPLSGFSLKLAAGGETLTPSLAEVTVIGEKSITLTDEALLRIGLEELSANPAAVNGKSVIIEAPGSSPVEIALRFSALNPRLVLIVDRTRSSGRGLAPPRMIGARTSPSTTSGAGLTAVVLHGAKAGALYDSMAVGGMTSRVDLVIPARVEMSATARNVIGLLRGSDPVLKDSYVLVTAHYDHIGTREGGDGDRVFNGANDDGSGTAAVIELANALSQLRTRPKRSLVFMTVFGEEGGLIGSRYYAEHPVFPLAKTVADINLEHLGRTDSAEGSQVNRASLTGFDYSDLGAIFKRAGTLTGIEVYKHERFSDAFFSRSDNQAFANAGVLAHTLCVSFDFPDYHRVSDHWDRIDYVNLVRTSRMVAVALWMVANNESAPRWNEENPRTKAYAEAWKRLQGR